MGKDDTKKPSNNNKADEKDNTEMSKPGQGFDMSDMDANGMMGMIGQMISGAIKGGAASMAMSQAGSNYFVGGDFIVNHGVMNGGDMGDMDDDDEDFLEFEEFAKCFNPRHKMDDDEDDMDGEMGDDKDGEMGDAKGNETAENRPKRQSGMMNGDDSDMSMPEGEMSSGDDMDMDDDMDLGFGDMFDDNGDLKEDDSDGKMMMKKEKLKKLFGCVVGAEKKRRGMGKKKDGMGKGEKDGYGKGKGEWGKDADDEDMMDENMDDAVESSDATPTM